MPDLQRRSACAQMTLMRAAPLIRRLPCALFVGAVLAGVALPMRAGAAGFPAAAPPPAVAVPAASPLISAPAAVPAKPLAPQDLLLACPTTRDYVGRVVASVTIDGKGPFRFIIDTGANQSTIAPRLVAALGLTPSNTAPMRVAGVTGTAVVPSVDIESLRAGALVIRHTRLPVIWSPIMAGADGILGAAGLVDDILLVDFQHDTVRIHRAGTRADPGAYLRLRARRLHGGLLGVTAMVGDLPVTAVIDTGSPQTLGNLALFQALYSRSQPRDKAAVTSVYGATRQVRRGEVRFAPEIEIGSIRIVRPVLVFGDFPIFKVWGLTDHPAIIVGMDVLGTVAAFSIDFRHAALWVRPRNYVPPPLGSGLTG
jgi:hypothetical protein